MYGVSPTFVVNILSQILTTFSYALLILIKLVRW